MNRRTLHAPAALRKLLVGCWVVLGIALTSDRVSAQAGLRESLERLDKNENGEIDPKEITPLARPYLERITKEQRVRLDKPVEIERLMETARIYYALKNGVAGKDVRPESSNSVKKFGPVDDEPLVPEFGLAKVKYPYTQDDLDEADDTLRREDRNEDGYIDRREASRARWTHRNPFDDDLDKDDRLSRLELGQRYARRRLLAGMAKELVQKAVRTGGEIRRSDDGKKEDSNQWWREGGDKHWLTAAMMSRFDTNRNGRLEHREAQQMGIPLGRADIDRDGEVSRDELFTLVAELQEEAGDVTEGLPGWFYELDADRDGQVEMAEFASEWTDDKYREFEALDLNEDGLLTSMEILQSKAIVGGSYRNQNAEVLPPYKTIISEIEVQEDYLIRDLNLQISITHSNVSFLDAYLTGPAGQRVELFSEVGGSGNHFDQTVFDDQAHELISKSKPPYAGTYLPQAMEKKQPGLSIFNGTSVKGVWQLVIRGTRNERFGMLHSWGLTVVPLEDTTLNAQEAAREEVEDGSVPADEAANADNGVSDPATNLLQKIGGLVE